MAEKKDSASNATTPIQVSVKLQDSPTGEKPPKSTAYAFTSNGRFITKADVNADGNATLQVPAARSPQEIRIVAGPSVDDKEIRLSDLTRRGGQQRFVTVSPNARVVDAVFQIPEGIWICWIRFCIVEGTLLKRLYTSGSAVDYPVCGAEVSIYDVEPIHIILPKLSAIELDKIRYYLLNPQPLPPDPPPDRAQMFSRLGKLEVAAPVATTQHFNTASPEFESIHRVAKTGDLAALRQSLLTVSPLASRFLICFLFPRLVTKRLLATVTTDRCGRFRALLFTSCNETLNLYFTAAINIFNFSLTIYEPTPVSCYTHWNYQCGTDVTLYTNSIFAPLCAPCPPIDAPENYVLIRALGNVQLNRIFGASTTLAGSTTADNIGQVADLYGADQDSPFGGNVLPRIEFDSSLRALDRATSYQVSYRKGTSGSFTVLPGQIDRKYNHFVAGELVTSVHNLGPKLIDGFANRFEIPEGLAPGGVSWVYPDPPIDHANAQFPTTELPAPVAGGTHGKYQLKLDLFDSSGNPVNIAAAGIRYFVPTTTDPDGTIHTADAATLGLVSGNSFIMTVHVDNRHTSGSLEVPKLDGTAANDCGVFRYAPGPAGTVEIEFTASHPDHFATYSYRISRGATELTSLSQSGKVSPATNPATFNISVATLLTQPDGSICDIAGFAEDLYVSALATDGWSRLSQYDSNPPPLAFVLAPTP